MEAQKQTVVQRYGKELEEIEEQIELVKAGEICDFKLMSKIKSLIISAYYDGKHDGIIHMQKVFKH